MDFNVKIINITSFRIQVFELWAGSASFEKKWFSNMYKKNLIIKSLGTKLRKGIRITSQVSAIKNICAKVINSR